MLVFVAFFALEVNLGVAKVHEVRKRSNAAHARTMKKRLELMREISKCSRSSKSGVAIFDLLVHNTTTLKTMLQVRKFVTITTKKKRFNGPP